MYHILASVGQKGARVFVRHWDLLQVGCLQARGLIVGHDVLHDLVCNTLEH
jgi:hypothetical protein